MICPNDASLLDQLNAFYASFENSNVVPGGMAITDPEDWVISLSEAAVRNIFNRVNTCKDARPTVIQGAVSEHGQNSWQAY